MDTEDARADPALRHQKGADSSPGRENPQQAAQVLRRGHALVLDGDSVPPSYLWQAIELDPVVIEPGTESEQHLPDVGWASTSFLLGDGVIG